jgi:hypothetical protein
MANQGFKNSLKSLWRFQVSRPSASSHKAPMGATTPKKKNEKVLTNLVKFGSIFGGHLRLLRKEEGLTPTCRHKILPHSSGVDLRTFLLPSAF